jgi:hypothetical protein
MEIVNVEVEAHMFKELKLDAHRESVKEMRRLFAKDTLEALADQVIEVAEEHCEKILNTEVEVTIEVDPDGSFTTRVFVGKIGYQKLPNSSQFNTCTHVRAAVEVVHEIQAFSKVLRILERKGDYTEAQGEMSHVIGVCTRELSYEIEASVSENFLEDMDQVHTDQWAKTMAVQGGLLFTEEGKVIEGAINYNQSTGV